MRDARRLSRPSLVFVVFVAVVALVAATDWFAANAAAADPALEPYDGRFASVTQLARYKYSRWGFLFVDLKTGETIAAQNADQMFIPASVTKCFSVAAALDAFGPTFRFTTPIHRRGEVDSMGLLRGDLILVASGDPTLGGRTTDAGEIEFTDNDHTYANGSRETRLTVSDPLAGLNELAKQIAAAGVRRVEGNVLIDDRLFDRADGSGSGPGRITPIMINDNVIDFTITPTTPGSPAKVDWRPRTTAVQIDVDFITTANDGKLATWISDLGHGRIHIHGQIPANHVPVVRIHEVPDAASYARTLLIEALERQGIAVSSPRWMENPASELPGREQVAALPQVAKFVSPPFSENARLILKVSHNLHASTLPMLLAAKNGRRSLAEGLGFEREFLRKAGVDVGSISFAGGAGGSRADHVTPRATVQLLRHMATRPDFAAYEKALPILGVDGTLAKSVDANSPARGKVFAKTGTLTWDNLLNDSSLLTSKALAGYLDAPNGQRMAFALFVNNVPLGPGVDSRVVGRDLGRVCELMFESARP
ncbi:MAG: D-alanyl-D-alanine carboxypeptidase/D-alanyl-D-alanine-endopeptidase [Pirellulales bacterium]